MPAQSDDGPDSDPEPPDGRNLRRLRNREAVVEAALEWLKAGVDEPTVEQITQRSGLSQRSLFRYFDSVDDLRAAVVSRYHEQLEAVIALPAPGDADLGTRIRRLADSRLALYNGHGSLARMARQRERAVPAVAAVLVQTRSRLLLEVGRQLGTELDRLDPCAAEEVRDMIDTLLSFEAWDLLSRVHGRSDEWITAGWCRAIPRLLDNRP